MLLDQTGAMVVLLIRHALEDLGGLREFIVQTIGIGAIDARIVLLGGYGQRQHLLFAQGIEWTPAKAENTQKHSRKL